MNSEEKLAKIKMSKYEQKQTQYTMDEILAIIELFRSSKSNEYNIELLSDFEKCLIRYKKEPK